MFEGIPTTILKSIAIDIVRASLTGKQPPTAVAIRETAEAFSAIEGLEESLHQWLSNVEVKKQFQLFIEGLRGIGDVPINTLVERLLETQFFLGDQSREEGRKILAFFFIAARKHHLAEPSVGLPHLANRFDVGLAQLSAQLEPIASGVQQFLRTVNSSSSEPTGLDKQLDDQLERVDQLIRDDKYADAQVLLGELERRWLSNNPLPPAIRARFHKLRGRILIATGENEGAAISLSEASELDPDADRAAINKAVAGLLKGNAEAALHILDNASDAARRLFQYFAARANVLISLKRFDEAAMVAQSAPTSNDSEEADRELLIGSAMREKHDYEKCREHAQRNLVLAPDNPDGLSLLATCSYEPALQQVNDQKLPPFMIPTELRAALLEGLALSLKAAARFEDQARSDRAFQERLMVGVISLALGSMSDAIAALNSVAKRSKRYGSKAWKHLGMACMTDGKYLDAVQALRHAVEEEGADDAKRLLFHAFVLAGDYREAETLARKEAALNQSDIKWQLAIAETLRGTRRWREGRTLLESLYAANPGEPYVALEFARHYAEIHRHDEAEMFFSEALNKSAEPLKSLVRFEYGGFLFRRQKFEKAIELWSPIVLRENLSGLLENYCISLFYVKRYDEVLDVLQRLQTQKHELSQTLLEIAAATHESVGNLDQAIECYERLGDKFGNQAKHLKQLAMVFLRRGRKDRANDLLDGTRERIKKGKDKIAFAQAYSYLDRHPDAVELAHEAVSRSAPSPEIHFAYVHIFTAATRSGFKPTDDQVASYQDTITNFEKRFPRQKYLRSFNLPNPSDISPILRELDEDAQHIESAIATYKQKKIPVSVFSKLVGHDAYQTWLAIVHDERLDLWTGDGTPEEGRDAAVSISKSSGVVLDMISLFGLGLAQCLDSLRECTDLFVAQALLDELHRLRAIRKSLKGGYLTLGKEGSQYYRVEITAEEAERMNHILDEVTEFVEQHCRVTGTSVPLPGGLEDLKDAVGACNVQSFQLARERNLALVTDDRALSNAGKVLAGVMTCSSQQLLAHYVEKGKFPRERYNRAVLIFLQSGYYYTNVDADQLYLLISDYQFQLNSRVRYAFRVLESESTTTRSVVVVSAQLLRLFFLEPLPDFTRSTFVFFILDTVTKHHPPLAVMKGLKGLLKRQMSFLLSLQLDVLFDLIDQWEKSKLIPSAQAPSRS